MNAEFEEKTYEAPLVQELAAGEKFFAPGQVAEATLGFDAAVLTVNPIFWGYWNMLPPSGIGLSVERWSAFAALIDSALPPFLFNCFVQAKRPERMVYSSATEFAWWKTAYFRFDIVEHQQQALLHLDTQVGNSAIVTYACPAFHKAVDLWRNIEARHLIETSNFCMARVLVGHARYSFLAAGAAGAAHSDPVRVESPPFLGELRRLRATSSPAASNTMFLENLAALLRRTADHGSRRDVFAFIVDMLVRRADVQHNLVKSLAHVFAFENAFNTTVLVGW